MGVKTRLKILENQVRALDRILKYMTRYSGSTNVNFKITLKHLLNQSIYLKFQINVQASLLEISYFELDSKV